MLKGVIATRKTVGHQFKLLNVFMEQIMNREMTKLDLTAAQSHIIGYLTHRKDVPCARDLEEFFRLSHPTVSGLLSRMEAKGFIEMRPDPEDRRIKRIYPLEKGLACSMRIKQLIDENERLIVEGFTPEEQALFADFLQRAVDNLGEKARQSITQREEQL